MEHLDRISLKRKIVGGATIIACVVLLLAAIVFAGIDFASRKADAARGAQALANLVAENVAAPLAAERPAAVTQFLATLRADPSVEAAWVADAGGRIVAHFERDGRPARSLASARSEGAARLRSIVETVANVMSGSGLVGQVTLETRRPTLAEYGGRVAGVGAVVIACAGFIAFGLATWLQKTIAAPFAAVADAVTVAIANPRLAARVERMAGDEFGSLVDGFNQLLAQGAARDLELRRAHELMEERVQERTRALGQEVAERRRMEEERDSFFAASSDLLCVAKLDGTFRRVNPAFHAILGYAPEELVSQTILPLIHAEDQDAVKQQLQRLLLGGAVLNIEIRMRHRDGSYRWVAWSATPRPGKDFFYACGRDVTALKEAERQMAREKARLQFIFESAVVGISLKIVQPDGQHTRLINDAHLSICGLRRDSLNVPGIFSRITHPDDYVRQAPLNAKLAAREIDRFSMDKRYVHADGSVVWAKYSIQWHEYPDGTREELSTVVDITALKQTEEQAARERARFKFIFDSVPVGICFDEGGATGVRERLLNDAHLAICGLTRGEVNDGAMRRIGHPDDQARQGELRQQLDRGLINRFSFDKRYLRSDGRIVWVNYSIQRRRCDDGSWQDLSTIVDITALKAAQEEVAAERARLRFIFEAVPVGISLVKQGDNRHMVNPAHERITGVSAANSQEPGIFGRVTHPEDHARQTELARPFLRGDVDSYSVEKRYLHSDGRVVWTVLTSRMFADPVTGTRQCVTSLVDITDLKRAQEEVVAERARLKFIFEAVPVGISLLLPGTPDVHVVNPAHEKLTGIRPDELLEPGIFERATHPEDFARQRPLVDAYKRGEVDHFTLEKRYLHPDGRVVWTSLTRRMFIDPSGRKQSVTTLVDISDVKRAQEEMARQQARFKFIFDAAPVGFAWAIEGDLSTRIVNRELERLTGVSAAQCQDLEHYRLATHPDDRARQHELIQQLRAREIDRFELEKRYVHPDGSVHWAAMTMQLLCDQSTGKFQELTTLVDITQRKEGEAKLEETHRQLVASSRQAGMAEVATGVLHNVGNVLNSVNVSASLIADAVRRSRMDRVARLGDLLTQNAENLAHFFSTDARGRQIPAYVQSLAGTLASEQTALLTEADSLRRNIEHIKGIVAMQQSYAKVSGVSEVVSVVELVEDAIRMNESGMIRDEIVLTRQFEARPMVSTEKHKVLQILVNLLRNARHACEEAGAGEKRIAVRVAADDQAVRIEILDNGVGIAPENLTRIFAHGFTTRKHGHGFGLHSGANAARELGGALLARSEGPGKGATFVLELPPAVEARVAG